MHSIEAETHEANVAYRLVLDAEAGEYWRAGVVTRLPVTTAARGCSRTCCRA